LKPAALLLIGLAVAATAGAISLPGCAGPSREELIRAGKRHYWRTEYDQAIGPFKGALEKDRSDPELLYLIGRCYGYLGDYREAAFYYRRCITSFPGHRGAARALADAETHIQRYPPEDDVIGPPEADMNHLPSAIAPIEPMTAPSAPMPAPSAPMAAPSGTVIAPSEPVVAPSAPATPGANDEATRRRTDMLRYMALAKDYAGKEDVDHALANYAKAIEVAPTDAWARAELGRYYMGLGRNDDAIEQLKQARALNPSEPGVAEALARLGAD